MSSPDVLAGIAFVKNLSQCHEIDLFILRANLRSAKQHQVPLDQAFFSSDAGTLSRVNDASWVPDHSHEPQAQSAIGIEKHRVCVIASHARSQISLLIGE